MSGIDVSKIIIVGSLIVVLIALALECKSFISYCKYLKRLDLEKEQEKKDKENLNKHYESEGKVLLSEINNGLCAIENNLFKIKSIVLKVQFEEKYSKLFHKKNQILTDYHNKPLEKYERLEELFEDLNKFLDEFTTILAKQVVADIMNKDK